LTGEGAGFSSPQTTQLSQGSTTFQSVLTRLQYHFPSERPDDDDPIWEEMRELGAELVEAVGEEKDKEAKKSYHLKAIAVVQCPWREVLYLVSLPTSSQTMLNLVPRLPRSAA
jgi:hypothetical protein